MRMCCAGGASSMRTQMAFCAWSMAAGCDGKRHTPRPSFRQRAVINWAPSGGGAEGYLPCVSSSI
eukprot:5833822-Pleurochrysis_carterae.AAC.1